MYVDAPKARSSHTRLPLHQSFEKQKRNQSAGQEKVPSDVYVEADGNHFARDGDGDYYANEEKSTSGSRVASIKTSLSRGIRSKFGGKKSSGNDTGDYQAPV